MSLFKQSILLFLTYTVIIVAVFYSSGQITSKTIYDRVIIRLEGPVIQVSNLENSKQFYESVLEFTASRNKTAESSENSPPDLMLSLPDKQRLFFKTMDKDTVSPQTVIIRVRNNLERLHSHIVYNYATYRKTGPLPDSKSEVVSNLDRKAWGQEFTVSDLDDNKFIFFKPTRKSGTRF